MCRGSARGQHVVGAADIVANGFWRVVSEEDCAGMADGTKHRLRIVDGQLDMCVRALDRLDGGGAGVATWLIGSLLGAAIH